MSSDSALRKQEHLNICKEENVASLSTAGWDSIRLPHCALPEMDFEKLDISVNFLGRSYAAPILISSMTGGSPEGEQVNELLAVFAEKQNIPMGVGSQRVALENRDKNLFNLRRVAPKASLFANIGVVQFNYGVTTDDCAWLTDKLQAQAFILHANVLQECIQSEGNRDFSSLFKKITELKKKLSVPVILKETGCGLDAATCKRAIDAGVDALDIAGLGGTHWGFIEGLRHPRRRELGEIFRDWGIPTTQALVEARQAVGFDIPIIASGGLRNGLDVAKALYLGANFTGFALPFLKAASQGNDALENYFSLLIESFKIATFCSGASVNSSVSSEVSGSERLQDLQHDKDDHNNDLSQ